MITAFGLLEKSGITRDQDFVAGDRCPKSDNSVLPEKDFWKVFRTFGNRI